MSLPSGVHRPAPLSQVWVGYIKYGNSYLDMQLKASNTEQQMRALQDYFSRNFTSSGRFRLKWVYCQHLVVLTGELNTVTLDVTKVNDFPREVLFDSLTKHRVLSAGFMRPEILQEHGDLFHETTDFDVNPTTGTACRKVLCIGHAVDKRLLCWPLTFTIVIASIAALVAGYLACNVSTGAEVGSFVGAVFTMSWAYVL